MKLQMRVFPLVVLPLIFAMCGCGHSGDTEGADDPQSAAAAAANPPDDGPAIDPDNPKAPAEKLAPDTGKVDDIKIVPLKLTTTNEVAHDKLVELKADGSLLFDGKALGKISGHEAKLSDAPFSTKLRSDGYVESSQGNELFQNETISNLSGAVTRVLPNGIVNTSMTGRSRHFGKVEGDLSTPEARRTALFIVALETFRIPKPPQ